MKAYGWLIAGLMVTGCNEIPGAAYYNRGDPENLLDLSSEVVTLGLAGNGSLNELSDMVLRDPPTSAELSCSASDPMCSEARSLLETHGVPYQFADGPRNGSVTLVYERVMARDCENRYIDNSINPYNLNPLTFGCSVTANMVQSVSDKRQFTNPNLLDFRDAEKAVQNYGEYLKPPSPMQQDTESIIESGIISGSQ